MSYLQGAIVGFDEIRNKRPSLRVVGRKEEADDTEEMESGGKAENSLGWTEK
jgi:hypothetical protein